MCQNLAVRCVKSPPSSRARAGSAAGACSAGAAVAAPGRDRPRRPARRPRCRRRAAPLASAAGRAATPATASFPHATFANGRPRRPRAPTASTRPSCCATSTTARPAAWPAAGSLREWEIVAQDREIEVAPGVKYEAWTYNGRVPGPTLRAREGELLRIRFVNASEHPHTMHFHGIHTALMDGMPGIGESRGGGQIEPGRELHLRVRRRRPSGSTSTTATSPRSPPTSPAASTAPSSSTRRRAGPKPTRW